MKKLSFMRLTVIALILLCSAPTVFAQKKSAHKWNSRRYEAQLGLGLTNFMGDINSPKTDIPVWVRPFKTTGYTADALLKYNLKGRHYVGSALYLGYMGAKEGQATPTYYGRGIAFKSFFTELSARYEFQIIRERRRHTIYRSLGETRMKNTTVPSYLFVGAGGIMNVGKFYWNSLDQRERYNLNYLNVAPVVMGGFGGKVRIDPITYIGFEAGWRVALSDGIDNCNKKGKPDVGSIEEGRSFVFGKWIDQYQFVTVSLVVTLRETRHHTPNFRSIKR